MTRFVACLRPALASVAALALFYLVRPLPAAEMTLEELIEAVRENELLYANIDVTMRDTYTDLYHRKQNDAGAEGASPPAVPPGTVVFSLFGATEVTARNVVQGQWFKYEERGATQHLILQR